MPGRAKGASRSKQCCQTGTSRHPELAKPRCAGRHHTKIALCQNQPRERAGQPACKQAHRPHQARHGHTARRAASKIMFFPAPKITLRLLGFLGMTIPPPIPQQQKTKKVAQTDKTRRRDAFESQLRPSLLANARTREPPIALNAHPAAPQKVSHSSHSLLSALRARAHS